MAVTVGMNVAVGTSSSPAPAQSPRPMHPAVGDDVGDSEEKVADEVVYHDEL